MMLGLMTMSFFRQVQESKNGRIRVIAATESTATVETGAVKACVHATTKDGREHGYGYEHGWIWI
jgi:hypothetical protein